MPKETRYFTLLPCSPTLLVEDRFDLTSSEEERVPYWSIIKATLRPYAKDINELISQLETLAITLRGTAGTDYGFLKDTLRSHLERNEDHFFKSLWPRLVDHALKLKEFYPYGNIPALSTKVPGSSKLYFPRENIACIVIHQFLCTFPRPLWMTDDCSPDFHIWYSSEQLHPKVVQAYLTTLFVYFTRIASNYFVPETDRAICYAFYSREGLPDPDKDSPVGRALPGSELAAFQPQESPTPFFKLTRLTEPETAPSLSQSLFNTAVISANKYVGFGRTGTQEETQVGSTPQACPVVLFTPPLRDLDVLVVQDVEPTIAIIGYGREARLDKVIPAHDRSAPAATAYLATFLFMDALELDEYDSSTMTPDLLPGNVDRELNKAYTAFSAYWHYHCGVSTGGIRYPEVRTGLWGCRTFGGNREIKTIIQMCAAGMAKVRLNFVLAGTSKDEESFAVELSTFADEAWEKRWRTRDVLGVLKELKPESEGARSALRYVRDQMAVRAVTSGPEKEGAVEEDGPMAAFTGGRRRSSIREMFSRRRKSTPQ